MYQLRDMELLEGNLASLFYLRLILAVLFEPLYLAGCTRSPVFKLYLGGQYPRGAELIVERQHKPRDRHRAAVLLVRTVRSEAVRVVIHIACCHLSVASEAELVVASVMALCEGCHCRSKQGNSQPFCFSSCHLHFSVFFGGQKYPVHKGRAIAFLR